MSHHIYHTQGIILSSIPSGEANVFYKIFTKDLGLVAATAQSVREGKSKLRYVLQDYALVTLDLVRGKEVWRIVSAGAWKPTPEIKEDMVRIKPFAFFCALLLRFLHGEGRDEYLFTEVVGVSDYLQKRQLPQELTLSFETLALFRILVHLGYMDPVNYEQFTMPEKYTDKLLEDFESKRAGILSKMNEALRSSHL